MPYATGLCGDDLDWGFIQSWKATHIDHIVKYTKRGRAGVIYHDTITNKVWIRGKVPYSIYLDQYLIDWLNNYRGEWSQRHRLREVLRDRGYIIDAHFDGKFTIELWGGMVRNEQ